MQVEIGPGRSCVADGSFGRQELGCTVWLATLDNKKVLRRRRNSRSFLIAIVIQPDTFLCQSFPWVTSIHNCLSFHGLPKVLLCVFLPFSKSSLSLYSCLCCLAWGCLHPCSIKWKKLPSFSWCSRARVLEFSCSGFSSGLFPLKQL